MTISDAITMVDALRPTLFYALTKEKWEKTR